MVHRKWSLIEDINTWIVKQTKDTTDGLRDGDRISLRDLNAIIRAIDCSQTNTTEPPAVVL